jgi:hypothetical protein
MQAQIEKVGCLTRGAQKVFVRLANNHSTTTTAKTGIKNHMTMPSTDGDDLMEPGVLRVLRVQVCRRPTKADERRRPAPHVR